MSFNIPGYFLDQKTKKLFKIQSHGPFSLKELQKRVREEETAASANNSTNGRNGTKTCSKPRSPTNLTQFLRQRATLGSLNNSSTNYCNASGLTSPSGIPFLMTQLKTRTKIDLEEPQRYYNNILVDFTSEPDYGELIMSHRSGRLIRYGYQVNPGFQMWNTGQHWDGESGEAFSLKFGSRSFYIDGQECRTIMGTNDGVLWRYSIPKLPALSSADLSQQFVRNGSIRDDGHILGYPPTSYLDPSLCLSDLVTKKKKDLFYSSDLDDENDHVIVGGDQGIYQFTSNFDLVGKQKVRSSIFATHLPKGRPHLCWTGARNGMIQLTDFRQNDQKNIKMDSKFEQSSSITRIQMLDGYELLTTAMDGSINIWDTRRPTTGNRNYEYIYCKKRRRHVKTYQELAKLPEPIRSLKGHVNESSRHLGFDIDLENNLLMLAGSDGKVRIWSIFNSNSNEPIWCSKKFSSPVLAVKFMLNEKQYPRLQDGWTNILEEPALMKKYPGVLLFGANEENGSSSSVQWLTGVK